jgi:hypothetical protein
VSLGVKVSHILAGPDRTAPATPARNGRSPLLIHLGRNPPFAA